MTNKATHKGECQACGSTQKLPGGVLSKHGYTVQWGFFNGVCKGAGYSPLEVSKDQIERYIAEAEELRDKAVARAAEIRKPVAEGTTKGWHYLYLPATFMRGERHSAYVWVETEYKAVQIERSSGSEFADIPLYKIYVQVPEQHRRRVSRGMVEIDGTEGWTEESSYSTKTLEARINERNDMRARDIDRDVKQIQSYIDWQRKRIEDWAPKALTPIKK